MAQFEKHTDGRTHMESGLARESLVSKKLIASTASEAPVQGMVPDVNMIAVGGQSLMDRGAAAILPLVEDIVDCREFKRIVGVGGGARARHTLSIGLDLGLPVGGLARIVGASEEQNRNILQYLLAPHGGITFVKDHFQDLPLYLSGGRIPLCIGQPPYHFSEPPPRDGGRVPDNGPDVGLFLMAEIVGAQKLIYVKDVDGIYDADPKKHPGAKFIAKTSAKALLDSDYEDLPIEWELLRTLENAQKVTSFRVINGLVRGNLRRALMGENVGTLVYASRHPV